MKVHENGIELSETEARRLKASAGKQDALIEQILENAPAGLTAFQVEDVINENELSEGTWPLTSIRRSLTNLSTSPVSNVAKTDQKREGRYGVDVHVYKYIPGNLFGVSRDPVPPKNRYGNPV